MKICHKAAPRSEDLRVRVTLRRKLTIASNCAPKPTPTLDLPDLTSGVWAAVPCSCFFTSTSIEELDDLNLQFALDPATGASPLAVHG